MTRRGRARILAVALPAALWTGCLGHDYRTKPHVAVVDGDPIVQMEKPGKFPSLTDPRSVPVRRHTDPPFRNEKVVGVSLSEPPRMYPVGLLDSYEVVNDEAGATPYVVARCALTNLSVVLDRRAGGRTLTFENSGALWRDMLVLRDRETGTYWTPAIGRALDGPLAGETLAILPAPVTTAEAWEELYPSTLCLETGDLTAVPLRLRLYGASGWEGLSGGKTSDARFEPKETVFFVAQGGEALAFTAGEIRARKRAEECVGGRLVTIEWDAALRAPRAWIPLAESRQEVPVIPIYWFALLRQFPRGQVSILRISEPAALGSGLHFSDFSQSPPQGEAVLKPKNEDLTP